MNQIIFSSALFLVLGLVNGFGLGYRATLQDINELNILREEIEQKTHEASQATADFIYLKNTANTCREELAQCRPLVPTGIFDFWNCSCVRRK